MRNNSKKPAGYTDRSIQGFCNRNGFSVSTGYKLLKSGKLKSKMVGTRRIIPQKYEDEFIDNLPDATI